jgi:NADH-quinone oxidoreductase subunit J
MNVVFYLSGLIAILATVMVITRLNIMHALLYMVVSLLAVAVVFYTLGAPFVAALEVIVYAGAIMVLFIFAVMLLNLGSQTIDQERESLRTTSKVGPSVLALILLVEIVYILVSRSYAAGGSIVQPQQVGIALFGPYLLGVELASFLLLTSLVGARHVGQRVRTTFEVDAQKVEKPVEDPQSIAMEEEGVK